MRNVLFVLVSVLVLSSCAPSVRRDNITSTPQPFLPPTESRINDFDLVADPFGLRSGTCSTLEEACALDYALEQLQPGQTLVLRGGVYQGSFTKELSGEGVTTLTGYAFETPLLVGSDTCMSLVGNNINVGNVSFGYCETGLRLEGNNNHVNRAGFFISSTGLEVQGDFNLVSQSGFFNNQTGARVSAGKNAVVHSRFSDNQLGLYTDGDVTEHNLFYRNSVGLEAGKTVRFNLAAENEISFQVKANSEVYNNTSVNSFRGFVSQTQKEDEPSFFVLNLSYNETMVELPFDADTTNSWNLGVFEPGLVSQDPESPLFGFLTANSEALNVLIPTNLPFSGFRDRLGARGVQ